MTKIAFTSCIRYEAFKKQPEWNQIKGQNPDYLFLLGDTIYMDYGSWPFSKEWVGKPEKYSEEEFTQIMTSKYVNQFEKVPEFKELVDAMRAKDGFFATWDDHDFAWNNAKGADVTKEIKNQSTEIFHQFTKCSTNAPHVYYHVDTPLGRVIFIDNRSDAEERGVNSRLISEQQFRFIEEKLNHSLPYTILCGGLTLTEGNENWTNYPKQLDRLCGLLEGKKNVIFLGGDIHRNKWVEPKRVSSNGRHTPLQLISSGMAVNLLGLWLPFDDQHNWAMLELSENVAEVTFYNKKGVDERMSSSANRWMAENLKN